MPALGPLDDDDARLHRELRAQQREFRQLVEFESEQLSRADRSIADLVLEFMHRGDTIRVAVGHRSWTGRIVHVQRP